MIWEDTIKHSIRPKLRENWNSCLGLSYGKNTWLRKRKKSEEDNVFFSSMYSDRSILYCGHSKAQSFTNWAHRMKYSLTSSPCLCTTEEIRPLRSCLLSASISIIMAHSLMENLASIAHCSAGTHRSWMWWTTSCCGHLHINSQLSTDLLHDLKVAGGILSSHFCGVDAGGTWGCAVPRAYSLAKLAWSCVMASCNAAIVHLASFTAGMRLRGMTAAIVLGVLCSGILE